ncbi:hypothetical protein B932_2632 [Gluconobacter oxydans H24]|nr:hypothetical protein B932_2632 [Gluconobacter oxydans H24]
MHALALPSRHGLRVGASLVLQDVVGFQSAVKRINTCLA